MIWWMLSGIAVFFIILFLSRARCLIAASTGMTTMIATGGADA